MLKSPIRCILILSTLLTVLSCEEKKNTDPPKTPEELAIEDLTGGSSLTWTVAGGGSVIRDGRSETSIYQTFEITFSSVSGKAYTSVNGGDLFDSGGNWSFVTGSLDKIILEGTKPASDIDMSFTRTGDSLVLVFTIVGPGGRLLPHGAVLGNYTFTLMKKA